MRLTIDVRIEKLALMAFGGVISVRFDKAPMGSVEAQQASDSRKPINFDGVQVWEWAK